MRKSAKNTSKIPTSDCLTLIDANFVSFSHPKENDWVISNPSIMVATTKNGKKIKKVLLGIAEIFLDQTLVWKMLYAKA